MNHSTTGTFTYVLSKYSRSYPTKRAVQNTQTQHSGSELASDWQHFTNSVIRLVLDVKSTSNGEIQSVRLRILWQLNADLDATSNQADMIFEDLDLLSFSTVSSGVPRKNQTEGLPLKAVYRDCVAGVRYLHSREDNTTPVYRRFQISFQNHSETSNFIDIIKPVCPCKINPTSIPPSLAPQDPFHSRFAVERHVAIPATASPSLPDRIPLHGFQPPSLPFLARQKLDRLPNMQTATQETFSKPFAMSSFPSGFQPSSDPLSSDSLNGAQRCLPLNYTQNPVYHGISSSSGISTLQTEPTPAARVTPTIGHGVSSNVPNSSLPSLPSSDNSVHASDQPLSMPKDTSAPHLQTESVGELPSSFGDPSSIYNMSSSALERAIGEIVHEDGFVQLLERLSEMLTVRALLIAP